MTQTPNGLNGSGAEPNPQIARNREDLAEKVAEVRANRDLNDSAKRRMIQEAYDEAAEEHKELAEEEDRAASAAMASTRRAAFSPPKVLGADKAMVAVAYRDALDRVEGLRTADELIRALERADRTGDEILAKAVLHRGYELESEKVVGAYLKIYPGERQKWGAFTRAAQDFNDHEGRRKLWGTMPPERPRELG